MSDREKIEANAAEEPPKPVEHLLSLGVGGLLLVLALSLWAWGIRLGLAGWATAAGWPPGLGKLLFPVLLTAALVGFGSWRMLLISLPRGVFGLSLGKWILSLFALAAMIAVGM